MLRDQDAFRMDNTEGYSQSELDALNQELKGLLIGILPEEDDYYEIIKAFEHEVAKR